MPFVSRRHLLLAAPALAGAAQTKQSFLAGVVPARAMSGGAMRPPGAPPVRPPAMTPAQRLENFWRLCDECATLGVHHIEVNNTYGQIVQTYDGRLSEFQDEMAKRKLRMLGFAMYSHLGRSGERQEMIDEYLRVARFLKAIGGRYIAGLIAPAEQLGNGDEESYRRVDVKAMIANCNEIGKRVKEETGIDASYHPEQGDIRAGFWDRVMDGTNPKYYSFWPDVGHLKACGVEPIEVYRKYRSRMVGTHLRDFQPVAATEANGRPERGRMVPFGTGTINLPELVAFLRETKFTGCVMGEGGGGSRLMSEYMSDKLGLSLG